MQEDGDLAIYAKQSSKPIWSTNTKDIMNGLIFQSDNNLVLYNTDDSAVWATMTNGTPVNRYIIQNDGNFVGKFVPECGNGEKVYWQSGSGVSTLYVGKENTFLPLGQRLISESGQVRLCMQLDGNLAIYNEQSSKPIWCTYTKDIKDGLVIQADGNLVLYNTDGSAVWATLTNDTRVDRYVIQNNGKLVAFGENNGVYWSSQKSTEEKKNNCRILFVLCQS